MEVEGIGMVLAKAMELSLKISNCIHKATATTIDSRAHDSLAKRQDETKGIGDSRSSVAEVGEADEDEEAERLMNICDALESLETQLASLQALQQQQRYEREAALSEIEHSRRILLDKLKDYKGEDLEVIHEASAFAAESVEHNRDLMLPPYSIHPPNSLRLVNGYFTRKSSENGLTWSFPPNDAKKEITKSFSNHKQTEPRKRRNLVGFFVSAAAKTLVTIVGVVSILNLSGFGRELAKKSMSSKVLERYKQPKNEELGTVSRCPPGKVLVVAADGEGRCVVKERIEIPFSSVVAKPDVNYGWG